MWVQRLQAMNVGNDCRRRMSVMIVGPRTRVMHFSTTVCSTVRPYLLFALVRTAVYGSTCTASSTTGTVDIIVRHSLPTFVAYNRRIDRQSQPTMSLTLSVPHPVYRANFNTGTGIIPILNLTTIIDSERLGAVFMAAMTLIAIVWRRQCQRMLQSLSNIMKFEPKSLRAQNSRCAQQQYTRTAV